MNQGWIYREQVTTKDAGIMILDYYAQKYRHSSRQEWQVRIEAGQILVNKSTTTPHKILQAGEQLEYHRLPWIEPEVPLEINILYEDQDLLVINKPSGLPVIPGGGFLEHTLLWQLKKLYSENTPTPIHRLGRGTSGILLLGRSSLAKSSLSAQMRHQTIEQDDSQVSKVYYAMVQGNTIKDNLIIEQPIGKIPHAVLGYLYGVTPQGKYACSHSKVIQRYQNHTLLEIRILTGRPHQIRIHLAAMGYPLIGDSLYILGGLFKPYIENQRTSMALPGDCGYFLHAHSLSFRHPRLKQKLDFTCPLPSKWNSLLSQLKIHHL